MHLADFINVVAKCSDLQFVLGEHGTRLLDRPGEVIAIIIHGNVGILRSIKAPSLAVTQPLIHPANDVARHVGEKF